MKHFLPIILVTITALTGCTSFQTAKLDGNSMLDTLSNARQVRVTTKDGRIRELKVVGFTSEYLIGELVTSTNIREQVHQKILLDDISFVQVRKIDVGKSALAGLKVVGIAYLAGLAMITFSFLHFIY